MRFLGIKMAYCHIRSGFGRVVLSVLAVALGVALVVGIQLMNESVLQSFIDTVDAVTGRAGLTVTGGEGLGFSESLLDTVAAVPGVKLAVPLVTGIAFPDDGSGELLRVHGVDLTQDAAVRLYAGAGDNDQVVDDAILFLSRPDSILVGREFAESRRLEEGGIIRLATPSGVKEFTIRGLLDSQGVARVLGGRLIVMDLYAAERAFGRDGEINQIDVVVDAGAGVERTRDAIAGILPPGLRVDEPALRKDTIRKTVGAFQMMLTAFGLLAVIAGFVICYSRLGAIFEARTWEVGLLRAVGLRRSVVFAELLKESLLLGIIGTALGLPLGILIGRQALPFVARATALNFHVPVPLVMPMLKPISLVAAVLVGLGAALLAASVPAYRISRKQPVAALTMRGRGAPRGSRQGRWLVKLLLLVGVCGLVLGQQTTRMVALGHGTSALVALAACIFAGSVVIRGGDRLRPILYRLFGPTAGLAAVHLTQDARRASLTVGTLGLGLGVILMFGMLGWSFERTLVTQVASRLQADLVITSAFVSGGWVSAPLAEDLLDALRSTPGIAAVAGEQRKDITYRDGTAVLDAYDPGCFLTSRICRWPLDAGAREGAIESVARGDSVIVSSSFAYRFGVRTGDILQLDSPRGNVTVQVAGVSRSEPTTAIILSRNLYRRFWNDDLVTWVHVAVERNTSRSMAEAAIARHMGEKYRLQIRSGSELIQYFADQARQAFSLLYLMEAITFLLVVIAVGDTLASAVADRTRELGMMRAVGVRREHLFFIVMFEGLTIGLLGLFIAVVVGLILGMFWVKIQFPALLGWQLDVHFPGLFTAGAAVFTVLLCLTASVIPALRAAYLPVTGALRNE